jgi:hypothetical protein
MYNYTQVMQKNNAIVNQSLYIKMLGMKGKHITKHPKQIFS